MCSYSEGGLRRLCSTRPPKPGLVVRVRQAVTTGILAALVNTWPGSQVIGLNLYDATGAQQGSDQLIRSILPRGLEVLPIPGVFGVTPPPTSGSVRMTAFGSGLFLGWFVTAQQSTGRVEFTAIGLDEDRIVALSRANAP